jgi:hypothetical protein
MSPRVARLHGRLHVLLAVQAELRAIGASQARIERNRAEIARIGAELALGDGHRRKCGDLTDATAGACS